MKDIPDGSIDAVICDPPYGTTACKWDSVIPFEPMWAQLFRILKPNGVIAMCCSQPFTSTLIVSNLPSYKYCWYWHKPRSTGFANAKKQPLRCIEDIAIFYKSPSVYNPQGLIYSPKVMKNSVSAGGETVRSDINESAGLGNLRTKGAEYLQEYTNYPRNVLQFAQTEKKVHPTQKPVALLEYLIRTYTQDGETVLDFTMGSGSTGVACVNTDRKFIGIELDEKYYHISKKRIEEALHIVC